MAEWKPGEMLLAINAFISETATISAKQLYFLEIARPLLSTELYSKTDKDLEANIGENVALLSRLCIGLRQQGVKIQVEHPESGEVAELAGIAYSTHAVSYQAGVQPTAGRFETWPLFDGTQIRISN